MKTYYSTFITGFSDIIKVSLENQIKDIQIDLIADGLVVYKKVKSSLGTFDQTIDIKNGSKS